MTVTLPCRGALVGFLYGENRAVRQCNTILDENWRELMKAIWEDRLPGEQDRDGEEADASPTVH